MRGGADVEGLDAERRGRRGLGWDEKEGARWSAPASKEFRPVLCGSGSRVQSLAGGHAPCHHQSRFGTSVRQCGCSRASSHGSRSQRSAGLSTDCAVLSATHGRCRMATLNRWLTARPCIEFLSFPCAHLGGRPDGGALSNDACPARPGRQLTTGWAASLRDPSLSP